MKTFSSSLLALDFALIAHKTKHEAAIALRAILSDCEAVQEQVETAQARLFNVLMCAARVATEMEIYREEENPETGFPFTNVDDWLAFHCPKCTGYAAKANKIQAGLPKATLPQLEAAKVDNIELLANYVSSESVKSDPAVIDATATMTGKEFRKHLSEKGECIEKPRIIFTAFPDSGANLVLEALSIVKRKAIEYGEDPDKIETANAQLMYWAADYIAENQEVPA